MLLSPLDCPPVGGVNRDWPFGLAGIAELSAKTSILSPIYAREPPEK